MAKRDKNPKTKPEDKNHVHIVKLRLSPEEVKVVRLAAAIENLQPGAFAKDIVLNRAKEIVEEFRASTD